MLSLDRRDICLKKFWVIMWFIILVILSLIDFLFWELYRKFWGKIYRGGFYWFCDMAIDDLGFIINLLSGEIYIYIYFVFVLDFFRESYKKRKLCFT